MTDSDTITAKVSRENGLFIATSPQFPNVQGQGPTAEVALAELHRAVEKYVVRVGALKKHPLYPKIREWHRSTIGPTIPFLPESEFHAVLETLNLDAVVTQQFHLTYRETAILGSALVGGDYDEGIHEALYNATGHSLGFALAHAAGLAFRIPPLFMPFASSTRNPGFVNALEAWAVCNELTKPFEGKKDLKWVTRNLAVHDHPAADFWQNACQSSFASIAAFNKALATEVLAAEAASRSETKRRGRGVAKRDSEFLHLIKLLWVPGALWCLSDSEIVTILAPEKKHGICEAYEKVRRNISTLKYTRSRLKPV